MQQAVRILEIRSAFELDTNEFVSNLVLSSALEAV